MLLARDRFGIKPLYYRLQDGVMLFGSEIKAMLHSGNEQESVNELKAYELLANCQLDTDEQTMFHHIFQLSPSTYVWVDANGKMGKAVEYWQFPEPGDRHFDDKAEKELIELFNETIQLHLRADVPVGTFLSGGIDSSSVTCFALKNMQQPEL